MSCPACFSGHADSNTPTGRIESVHGRETYVATPSEGKPAKGIIVIIPDAFGLPFVNNRILADHYAAMGQFKVYLPDFMNGKAASAELLPIMNRLLDWNDSWLWKPLYVSQILFSMVPFIYSNRWAVAWPRITSFLSAVRLTDEGAILPIGVAGFCWGGPATLKLASDSVDARTPDGKQPLANAFFTAHPSNLSIPADIEQIKTNSNRTKAVLAKMADIDSEVIIYPGAGHGFAVRADKKSNTKAAEQANDAEKQAIAWFQKQFARVK